jgi:hypothetical protein
VGEKSPGYGEDDEHLAELHGLEGWVRGEDNDGEDEEGKNGWVDNMGMGSFRTSRKVACLGSIPARLGRLPENTS